MIYPGPLGIPEVIPATAPPSFWLAANDDRQPARTISEILPKYRAAKVPIGVHLFAKGGHAFNMGNSSKLSTIKVWPNRLADWLTDYVVATASSSASKQPPTSPRNEIIPACVAAHITFGGGIFTITGGEDVFTSFNDALWTPRRCVE